MCLVDFIFQEKKNILKERDYILNKVKAVLEDEHIMENIGKLYHEKIEDYKSILKKIQLIDIVLDEEHKLMINSNMMEGIRYYICAIVKEEYL